MSDRLFLSVGLNMEELTKDWTHEVFDWKQSVRHYIKSIFRNEPDTLFIYRLTDLTEFPQYLRYERFYSQEEKKIYEVPTVTLTEYKQFVISVSPEKYKSIMHILLNENLAIDLTHNKSHSKSTVSIFVNDEGKTISNCVCLRKDLKNLDVLVEQHTTEEFNQLKQENEHLKQVINSIKGNLETV